MISGQEKGRSWWSGLGVCWILLTALSLQGQDAQPPTITFFDLNQSVPQEFTNKVQFSWQKFKGLTFDPATQTYVSNYFLVHFPIRSNWFYTVWSAGTINAVTWDEYPTPYNQIKPARFNGVTSVVLAIGNTRRFYQVRATPSVGISYN